jgi:hypothetical protein
MKKHTYTIKEFEDGSGVEFLIDGIRRYTRIQRLENGLKEK